MKDIEIPRELLDLLHVCIKSGYDRGYDEGVKDGQKGKISEMLVDTYTQGLNDAWECAKKIVFAEFEGGLSVNKHTEIFGNTIAVDVMKNYTASEVIAKIKEYEDKHKCKECKWDEFRDAQHPVGTPCDSCFEGKNFSPKVARCGTCSILNDTCPYDDITCMECEVHCSIERAKQKLKKEEETDES